MNIKNFLFTIIVGAITNMAVAQDNFAIVSVFGTNIDADPESSTPALNKFMNEEEIPNDVIKKNLDKVIAEIGNLFKLEPTESYIDESFYKYVLDEYELAPENLAYSITGLSIEESDQETDYRLNPNQAVKMDKYLAIGTARPFNNKPAVTILFGEIPNSKAMIFIEFSVSNGYVGSEWGVGELSSKVSMRIKVLSKEMKTVLKANVSGKSDTKFSTIGKDFERAPIEVTFQEAMDNLITNISTKLSKKVSKMKI